MALSSMGIGGSLRSLGRFIDACEQQPQVEGVALRDDWRQEATGVLTANVELTLSARPTDDGRQPLSLGGGRVDEDGGLSLTFETVGAVLPARADGLDLEPVDAAFTSDGTVTVTVAVTTPVDADAGASADGASSSSEGERATGPDGDSVKRSDGDSARRSDGISAKRSDGNPAGDASRTSATRAGDQVESASADAETDDPVNSRRDRDVPPFRDYELLREVYDACDTFGEMPEALGMDVTAETVRRYMIDYGIHEPNSYDTSDEQGETEEEAEPKPPVVVADGVGLPDDVTVDTLVETVRSSNTLYEVQTDLGVDREDALELLKQLDLVGNVVGRLTTESEREVSRELIVERLRRHTDQAAARAGD